MPARVTTQLGDGFARPVPFGNTAGQLRRHPGPALPGLKRHDTHIPTPRAARTEQQAVNGIRLSDRSQLQLPPPLQLQSADRTELAVNRHGAGDLPRFALYFPIRGMGEEPVVFVFFGRRFSPAGETCRSFFGLAREGGGTASGSFRRQCGQ